MKRLVISLIFLLSISLVSGSYITIVTRLSSEIMENNSTQVNVELEQRGDEAAYEVEVVPFPSDYFDYEGVVRKDRFDPGDTLHGFFSLHLKKKLIQGNYPFVVKTVYHDANMYPFSVVSSHLIVYKAGYQSDIVGSIKSLTVEKGGSGETILKIRNLGNKRRVVNVRLYLPTELKGDESEKFVSVDPGEEKEIKYTIRSRGALPGSSYNILASLEYESENHYTSFASGLVKIVEKKDEFNLLWILIVLFIVLLSIFIYLKVSGEFVESIGSNSHLE